MHEPLSTEQARTLIGDSPFQRLAALLEGVPSGMNPINLSVGEPHHRYPQIAARFVGRYRNKRDETLFGAFTGHAMREGLIVASILGLAVTLWSLFWPGIEMDARKLRWAE